MKFQFDYYNKSLTNCKYVIKYDMYIYIYIYVTICILSNDFDRFLGGLFKRQALPTQIIASYITELLKECDYLQIHCLCITLILTGPKLSKVIVKIVFIYYL